MEDNLIYKGLRKKLVETLKQKGIHSEPVLAAIEKVPRHLFVNKGLEKLAYEDQALPISEGQTISQPYTVAFQTQLLQIEKGDKVLEIGTGSGYQAAILAEMGARVFTIERIHQLFLDSQARLNFLGYKVHQFYGDGYLGKAAYAPFNKIIVTAGAKEIPQMLVEQLAAGGRMVIPVGDHTHEMTLIEKNENNQITITKHGQFIFVPFVKGK
ncbi:MAG: protein-L-isoaspartate(D-aspartate) O-methyltransferase [Bacteroidales bacterium]|nr:protein-L-isoaspartate(D-aspartate) O-methyltransferase [Bacteroidales bacterium]